ADGGADYPAPDPANDAANATAAACFEHARELARASDGAEDAADILRQALAWQRLGLEKEPANVLEHQRYLLLLQKAGAHDEKYLRRAVAEYRAMWTQRRDSPMYSWMLAAALTLLPTRANLDEAQSVLRNALNQHPDDYWLNYRMGVIALTRDDMDGARHFLQRAADIGPGVGRFDASWLLAQLHMHLGEYRDAAMRLQTVVSMDRDAGIDAWEDLARMLSLVGEHDRAVQVLEQELPPRLIVRNGPRHLRVLGVIYRAAGNLEHAAWCWRMWLNMMPSESAAERMVVEEWLDEIEWELRARGK
ncbi:MAG: tetratricopeptide repeat protein, partial [Planctomycetota bacterium]